jgi:leukotriene-A4 hydrolase
MATLRDPNTLSNYNSWTSSHITAQLEIDFNSKRLVGNVILKLKSLTDKESKEIKLDTR